MSVEDMGRFWDERAREDAFFFVDNRLRYGDPDTERFWQEGETELDRLLDAAGVRVEPGDAVLDLGCGIGRLTRPLAARAGRVVALDVSREMLVRGRELNPGLENVEWMQGDGASLGGVPDGSIDAAVSLVVFQHIPDSAIILGYVRELGRALRPGGWAAFQVSTDPSVHARRSGLRARVAARLGRAPRGQDDPAWLGSAVDLDELRLAAGQAGLNLERVVNPGAQFTLVVARRA